MIVRADLFVLVLAGVVVGLRGGGSSDVGGSTDSRESEEDWVLVEAGLEPFFFFFFIRRFWAALGETFFLAIVSSCQGEVVAITIDDFDVGCLSWKV